MSYWVYKIASLGAPRDHTGIFVGTEADSGVIFHVTGSILRGMVFEKKAGERPERSNSFVEKTLLGWVAVENFHRMEGICQGVPPPKRQYDGFKRLYPQEPLRRCHEWTDETIEALIVNGVLHTQDSVASSSAETLGLE